MKRFWVAGICATALSLPAVYGQAIISARSGLVHYVEGDAYLGDQQVNPKVGQFPDVKEKAVFRTEVGRAEVLLNPGVILRLGEHSSFRMITNRLIDTRVELLTGSAVLEADEVAKDTSVTVVAKDAAVTLRKAGIYRFDMEPARLHVYSGDAQVTLADRTIDLTAGKMMAFEGESATTVQKFDKDETDALTRWSRRRGEQIALANVSAAKGLRDSGYSLYSSVWRWNPYFGMMTFIPASGMLYSPWGYRFWSPATVYRVYYNPPPQVFNGGGYNGSNSYGSMSQTSSGYSGTVASSPGYSSPSAVSNSGSTAAAAAPSSSVGRGSGGGGGRQQ